MAGCSNPPAQSLLVLKGATVIDVQRGAHLIDATIVIDHDRITMVGPATDVRVPRDARVVDVPGKYVIPGLWDVHTHIQNERELDLFFPLLVAHGVIGIRDVGGLLPRAFHEFGQQHQYAPHVVACGPIIGDVPDPGAPVDGAIVDELADKGVDCIKVSSFVSRERFLAIAARARARGLDVVGHVPVAVSATEASDAGLRTMEHLDEMLLNASLNEAELRATRVRTLNRLRDPELMLMWTWPPIEPFLSRWSDDKAAALFATLVKNGSWQTPTLEDFHVWWVSTADDQAYWNDPNLRFIPKDWLDGWHHEHNAFLSSLSLSELAALVQRMKAWYESELMVTKRMRAAGIQFLAGTDVSQWNHMVAGASLHDELERMVEAGLTPLDALRAATINPAMYLRIESTAGTIAVGKRADVVILDADPTKRISNSRKISAVVLGGRLIDRSALDALLQSAGSRAAQIQPR